MNTSLVAFIALSIASRFVFTSFSADGQAIWLMKTAPDGWFRFMRGKLLVFGLPTLLFAEALSVFSGAILGLNKTQLLSIGLHSFWDAAVMILTSLVLGMIFANPRVENPLKLIVSPGGLLLMSTGLFLTGLHVFLRLTEHSPRFNAALMHLGWPNVQDGRALWYYLGLILIESIALLLLIKRGIHHLRSGDFT